MELYKRHKKSEKSDQQENRTGIQRGENRSIVDSFCGLNVNCLPESHVLMVDYQTRGFGEARGHTGFYCPIKVVH